MRQLAAKCTGIDVAVAFLTREGYNIVEPVLTKVLDSGHPVRMVVGLSDHLRVTDKEAVGDLMSLKSRYRDGLLKLRSYNNPGFHPKLFLFKNGTEIQVIVGSSNLTKGGQRDNTEANVRVRHPSPSFRESVEGFYSRVWAHAKKLTRERLGRYHGRPKFSQVAPGKHDKNPVDDLPPAAGSNGPSRLPRLRKWWKLAPGYKGEVWLDWYDDISTDNKGIVSIGWDWVGNLNMYRRDIERLRSAVVRLSRRKRRRTDSGRPEWKSPKAIGRITHTLANFAGWGEKPVRKGDGIIAYSNKSVYAMGEVIGGYLYRPEAPRHKHSRTVRWYKYVKAPPRATQSLVDYLGRYNTLMQIERDSAVESAWNLIQWK
jgi:HKD family nuclease